MLDQVLFMPTQAAPHVNCNIKVEQTQADSARLLMELEREAVENLVRRFDVEDNVVKGRVFVFEDRFARTLNTVSQFSINGREFVVRSKALKTGFDFDPDNARKRFHEDFVGELSRVLMESAEYCN